MWWSRPKPPDVVRGYDERGPFIECVGVKYRLEADCERWIKDAFATGYRIGYKAGLGDWEKEVVKAYNESSVTVGQFMEVIECSKSSSPSPPEASDTAGSASAPTSPTDASSSA